MLEKIAFFAYPVTDMKRSVGFYQDTLGFRLLFEREDWSELEIGGQRLALQKIDPSSRPPASPGAVISFLARPIEPVMQALEARGVVFLNELEVYPYGKLAWFPDPDGNRVGLYEPPQPSEK